jgi:CheY-like chemotaxis protein
MELKSILLAEDSAADAELTLEALKGSSLANEVQVVRDGAEALDYLLCRGAFSGRPPGNPAVLLLDIKMPKVSGLELLRLIRGDRNLKILPVVVLTSSREDRDLEECYKLGVNAYVVKPVKFEEFVEAVKLVGAFWAVVNERPPGSIKKQTR